MDKLRVELFLLSQGCFFLRCRLGLLRPVASCLARIVYTDGLEVGRRKLKTKKAQTSGQAPLRPHLVKKVWDSAQIPLPPYLGWYNVCLASMSLYSLYKALKSTFKKWPFCSSGS